MNRERKTTKKNIVKRKWKSKKEKEEGRWTREREKE